MNKRHSRRFDLSTAIFSMETVSTSRLEHHVSLMLMCNSFLCHGTNDLHSVVKVMMLVTKTSSFN